MESVLNDYCSHFGHIQAQLKVITTNLEKAKPNDGSESHDVYVRKGGAVVKFEVENSWIFPCSPGFLRKFRTNMKVELCISRVISIKYLFKYVCEGSHQITEEIGTNINTEKPNRAPNSIPAIHEIQQYRDAGHISASEAARRIFSFPILEHQPTVERLEILLEGRRTVYFGQEEHQKAKNRKRQANELMA